MKKQYKGAKLGTWGVQTPRIQVPSLDLKPPRPPPVNPPLITMIATRMISCRFSIQKLPLENTIVYFVCRWVYDLRARGSITHFSASNCTRRRWRRSTRTCRKATFFWTCLPLSTRSTGKPESRRTRPT